MFFAKLIITFTLEAFLYLGILYIINSVFLDISGYDISFISVVYALIYLFISICYINGYCRLLCHASGCYVFEDKLDYLQR